MIWVILELLAASFAMGLWTSSYIRRQNFVSFLWIVALVIIIHHLGSKL
jgi:hypothetical protein